MDRMSPVLQDHVLARDAVDDHLVDRGAEHGRVVVVAQEGRLAPSAACSRWAAISFSSQVLMPGLGRRLEHVEHVGDDQVGLAQLGDLRRRS